VHFAGVGEAGLDAPFMRRRHPRLGQLHDKSRSCSSSSSVALVQWSGISFCEVTIELQLQLSRAVRASADAVQVMFLISVACQEQ